MKNLSTIFNLVLFLSFLGCEILVAQPFVHSGVLHTESDFIRMRKKVNEGAQPWKGSWDKLVASPEAQLSWTCRATATVIRGGDGDNVALLYKDVAAAYQHALIWKISEDSAHGDKAIEILNAWSATHTLLSGNADRYLASGLFGYQFANAAEMMRDYPGFELERFQNYMLNVFYYPLVERFLLSNQYGSDHNDACITNYWANWDLCNMAAMLAIGVLCDNREIYNKGIEYFKNGAGNGSIEHAVPFVHSDTHAQWQESGRDQGHTILGVGLMSSVCEIAWNQGDDLYSYGGSRFRKGAEYVAKYNLGYDVPFTTYSWGTGQNCDYREHNVISSAGRGELRPVWELIYNHYTYRSGQGDFVSNIAAYAKNMRPEGGPGGHATTYDQPGFGSLTHTIDSGSYFYPWISMDIGNVTTNGDADLSEDTVTINGSGTGIQGNSDKFHYVFQSMITECEIWARVVSIENTNEWAKAGVMISESLDTMAARAIMCVTPLHGTLFQSRTTTGDTIAQTIPNDGITTPYWVKISRSGDTITGYKSANGLEWTEVGSSIIDMPERIYVGLFGTSSNGSLCTSLFDSIQVVQGNVAPDVIIESPIDGADNYITGADVLIEAYANDYDDSISIVEFYLDDIKLAEDSIVPFSFTLDSVVEGNHTISVRVTDSRGASRTSTVNITVYAPGEEFPWYKFDETDGTLAEDANSYGLDAILKGGVMHVSSLLDMGVDFDGNNDYVLLPEGVVHLLGNFTISTWVKLDAVDTWSRVFDFGTGTGNYMFFTPKSGSGKARFVIRPTSNSEQQLDADAALSVNKWTHVAVTLAGDTGIIYIDGEQAGINAEMTFRPYNIGNTNQNYLGRSQYSADPYLDGQLDNFRIYNYALSPEEIQGLVNDPNINYPPIVSITSPLNNANFTIGDTILIEADVSDVDSDIQLVEFYNWSTKIGEDSTAPYTYTLIGTNTGTQKIKAVVTSDNGATTTSSDVTFIVTLNMGINKNNSTDNFEIFPNPTSEMLYFKGLINAVVQLYDQTGRISQQTKITNDNHIVDISSLSAGIYIIKIMNNNTILTKKLIIK